jgi:hypothetical protein
MASLIPASGLSVVTPTPWALRLFYQLPGGSIGQSLHANEVWSQETPTFKAIPLSPLASVTWDEGKEVSIRARFRYAA